MPIGLRFNSSLQYHTTISTYSTFERTMYRNIGIFTRLKPYIISDAPFQKLMSHGKISLRFYQLQINQQQYYLIYFQNCKS